MTHVLEKHWRNLESSRNSYLMASEMCCSLCSLLEYSALAHPAAALPAEAAESMKLGLQQSRRTPYKGQHDSQDKSEMDDAC